MSTPAAMALVTNPRRFDVILTENMFGDILSDELSVIAGSIGLLGSASVGSGGPGRVRADPRLRAADSPDRNVANPAGAIASAVLMLDELGLGDSARLLVQRARPDLGRRLPHRAISAATATCSEFGERVRWNLAAGLVRSGAYRELIAMNRGCCG